MGVAAPTGVSGKRQRLSKGSKNSGRTQTVVGVNVGVRVREADRRVAVEEGMVVAVGCGVGVSVGLTTVDSGVKVLDGKGVGVEGSVAVVAQQTVGTSVGGGLGAASQKYSHHPTDNTNVANSPVVTPKLK